jgi:hypothetical protein
MLHEPTGLSIDSRCLFPHFLALRVRMVGSRTPCPGQGGVAIADPLPPPVLRLPLTVWSRSCRVRSLFSLVRPIPLDARCPWPDVALPGLTALGPKAVPVGGRASGRADRAWSTGAERRGSRPLRPPRAYRSNRFLSPRRPQGGDRRHARRALTLRGVAAGRGRQPVRSALRAAALRAVRSIDRFLRLAVRPLHDVRRGVGALRSAMRSPTMRAVRPGDGRLRLAVRRLRGLRCGVGALRSAVRSPTMRGLRRPRRLRLAVRRLRGLRRPRPLRLAVRRTLGTVPSLRSRERRVRVGMRPLHRLRSGNRAMRPSVRPATVPALRPIDRRMRLGVRAVPGMRREWTLRPGRVPRGVCLLRRRVRRPWFRSRQLRRLRGDLPGGHQVPRRNVRLPRGPAPLRGAVLPRRPSLLPGGALLRPGSRLRRRVLPVPQVLLPGRGLRLCVGGPGVRRRLLRTGGGLHRGGLRRLPERARLRAVGVLL